MWLTFAKGCWGRSCVVNRPPFRIQVQQSASIVPLFCMTSPTPRHDQPDGYQQIEITTPNHHLEIFLAT